MKIFLLMDPPTVTAQERKVVVVRRKPIFYKPENVQKAQNEIIKYLKPLNQKNL